MSPAEGSGRRRLDVTYLAPFIPFRSVTHAGGRFLYHYLTRLSSSVDITLVAPATEPNGAALDEEIPPVAVHLATVRRPRTRAGLTPRLVADTVAGVTPGWHVLRGFRNDPWIWDRVRESDIVELQWAWYLPFVRDIRKVAPRVAVTAFEHDVLTVSSRRRAVAGYLHERTFGRLAAARVRKREPALLNECDGIFTFSELDRDFLRSLGVVPPIEVVDPIVRLGEPCQPPRGAPTVLFLGAMNRPENHQGAMWFANRVWPAVHRACPDARLILAGTSPPPSMRSLAGASVTVTGHVDSVDALYRKATVFVAPNLTGAGVKFKVLDAMGFGLPVVATPVAAEGIADGATGAGFSAITDDPVAMADAVVDLLSHPDKAMRIGTAGRAWIAERYDFATAVERVLAMYDRVVR